ncbi:LysR family transcriptional regulator [Streptomyces sp. NPDC002896]|uniref:LysR family transcriptional regulator n=1 Tax=Streptomyces sp. NPDC002896 TaxID=3154438 RepID=UPI00332824EF
MKRVQLHQLRYAVAIAEEGSFTRAATKLYLAQPSLSVQIRKLEQELGVRLFERLGRSAVPTSSGELFLVHARRILAEVDRLHAQMEEIKNLKRGRVALGVLPSVGTQLLPDVLTAYHQQHPGVDLVLMERDTYGSVEFERRVHQGELDIAVVRLPVVQPGLATRPLIREPLFAMLPPGHPLAGAAGVSLADLADETFVALPAGNGLRDLMDAVCARAGFTPKISVETSHLPIMWSMVQSGLGIALLPRLAAAEQRNRVLVTDPYAERELGVIYRSTESLSPSAEIFLDLLLRFAASHSDHWPGALVEETTPSVARSVTQ